MTTLGKHVFIFSCRNLAKTFSNGLKISRIHTTCPKYLYSADILGLERFKLERSRVQEQMRDFKEKFCDRMENYMANSATDTIFTDDLKTLLYLTETEEDINLAEKMMKRYYDQGSQLRFSKFVFGPVVLRLLYTLNLPGKAYQLFTDAGLLGFFDQMASYRILMDLQFENRHYKEALEVYDLVMSKNMEEIFTSDCNTLALAACLKLNTPESFAKALTIAKHEAEYRKSVTARGTYYAAALALRQNAPEIALELLSTPVRTQSLFYINIKALTYAALGRTEEAVNLLRSVLEKESPDHVLRGNELIREVVTTVETAVRKLDNVELNHQYKIILQSLESGNHIADIDFEEFIFRPIVRRRQLQDGYKSRDRPRVLGYKALSSRKGYYRPSLSEGD